MAIQIIQDNKSVRHDYHVIETFEAGLVLVGSEVKAIRERSIQLKDSYIDFKGHEAFLQNAPDYDYCNYSTYRRQCEHFVKKPHVL